MTVDLFRVAEEVGEALRDGRAVVGLETSVIGQGLPFPENRECAVRVDRAIRAAGAMPAWIGVLGGTIRVGLSEAELTRFTEPGAVVKVARRDYPAAVASELPGATTVSATIWAAERAGIAVCATGGIGGVHPGDDPDVSADLLELSRTPGLLVCSGPKSIVDPAATVERLEELGVAIVGYGVDRLPFFLARESPVPLEHRTDTPGGAAAMLRAAQDLELRTTILVCNPVPASSAMDAAEVEAAACEAERRAEQEGIRGKARTPFALSTLAELTGGRSLRANLDLLEDNARVAGEIAAALEGTAPAT
ncbi:MAG: pseudouridine-5'-phosphate glycosidase [Actinomycetota bacterium]|nr:pseudouridine-5'-phosphate glycosidase [Actinomycetota bacterium]